jgi:hypothetical protein
VNPIEHGIRAVDAFQQARRPWGFIFGVIKKFGDDSAGSLAALVAYYGFVSLFPLLLVLITILGLVVTPGTEKAVVCGCPAPSVSAPLGGLVAGSPAGDWVEVFDGASQPSAPHTDRCPAQPG